MAPAVEPQQEQGKAAGTDRYAELERIGIIVELDAGSRLAQRDSRESVVGAVDGGWQTIDAGFPTRIEGFVENQEARLAVVRQVDHGSGWLVGQHAQSLGSAGDLSNRCSEAAQVGGCAQNDLAGRVEARSLEQA